jgi:hypothetical protein
VRNFVAITLFLTFIITAALGLTTEIKRAQETATEGLTQDMTVFMWPPRSTDPGPLGDRTYSHYRGG